MPELQHMEPAWNSIIKVGEAIFLDLDELEKIVTDFEKRLQPILRSPEKKNVTPLNIDSGITSDQSSGMGLMVRIRYKLAQQKLRIRHLHENIDL